MHMISGEEGSSGFGSRPLDSATAIATRKALGHVHRTAEGGVPHAEAIVGSKTISTERRAVAKVRSDSLLLKRSGVRVAAIAKAR